jgi:hypothetical protein
MKIAIFNPPSRLKFATVKNFFLLCCVIILFAACRKEVDFKETNDNAAAGSTNISNSGNPECDWNTSIRNIATFITQKAYDHPDLRKWIYKRCHEEHYGDYNTKIQDIKDFNQAEGNPYWDESEDALFAEWMEVYRCGTGLDPIVFIPHIEEIDPLDYFDNNNYPTGLPEVVFMDEYDENNHTAPTYVLASGVLQINSEGVDEEYAWANDVWVFGEEEEASPGNQVANPKDDKTKFEDDLPEPQEIVRNLGHMEYAGIMQVTSNSNLRDIEHWIHGKLEFKILINNSDGSLNNDFPTGKWRRKNFKNARWHDFNLTVGYWWLNNWGPEQLERWIEEDGGSQTVNITQTINPGSGFPSTTITHQVKSDDDNLGAASVQFTDPALPEPSVTTYTLGKMNFRRRTEP